MVANVHRRGDKVLVEIDADLFQRSGIDPDQPVDVGIEPGRLVLSHAPGEGVSDGELDEAFQKAHQQYGRMLKRLAE